jgi:hypothetical protein
MVGLVNTFVCERCRSTTRTTQATAGPCFTCEVEDARACISGEAWSEVDALLVKGHRLEAMRVIRRVASLSVASLGLVLILALVVRNYIQWVIRSELAARSETVPHPFTKKKESNLTPEMAFEHFGSLLTQVVTMGDQSRRMPMRLTDPAAKILSLFSLDVTIFEPPPPVGTRKWRRRPKQTPGM